MQETRALSLGWEDPLEKGMATQQYSCLENPMDRGPWQATVHGTAKSQIQLSDSVTTRDLEKLKKIFYSSISGTTT